MFIKKIMMLPVLMLSIAFIGCGEKEKEDSDTDSTDSGNSTDSGESTDSGDSGDVETSDVDADGFTIEDGDCDDNDPAVFPYDRTATGGGSGCQRLYSGAQGVHCHLIYAQALWRAAQEVGRP